MILKEDGLEIEVGSIGVQFDGWHWGIDSIVPMREEDGEGSGKDRADCVRQFRAAWDRFSADPARLSEFQAAAMIKRVTLEPPPEVARRFFEDMSAFHRERNPIKRDEIAARQLHAAPMVLPPMGCIGGT